MKDKELNLEIEGSLTLGGVGEGRVQGRGKWRRCTYCSDVRYTTTNGRGRTVTRSLGFGSSFSPHSQTDRDTHTHTQSCAMGAESCRKRQKKMHLFLSFFICHGLRILCGISTFS
jgi:hypothetical protein